MKKYHDAQHDPFGNITYGSVMSEEFVSFFGNRDVPVFIEKIGITYPDSGYFIKRKKCGYIVLEYVLDGVGHIIANDKEYTVKKNDVYMLLPGSSHHYYADREQPYKKIWINFFSDTFVNIIHSFGMQDDVVFHASPKCQSYFDNLLHLAENDCLNDAVYIEASKNIFSLLTDLAMGKKAVPLNESVAKNTQIMLDNCVYGKPEIQKIADELFVSVAYLIRQFQKEYGVTPYQYLLAKKINLAKDALKNTDLRIGEISRQLSFDDEHYFSSMFKAKTGLTPSSYRRTVRENK